MAGQLHMEHSGFREQLASIAAMDVGGDRHLDILSWITQLAVENGLSKPVLVGCGAVEVYTSSKTATGDIDIILDDIPAIASILLELGFQRSSDQRFYYFPGYSILFEFPPGGLRPGEKTIIINHKDIECSILCPEDLIVNRLESFEASGGGIDLYHAFLIYHLHFDHLDRERLRECVKARDVRESFIFIRKLHLESIENNLTMKQLAESLIKECRFRRGE